MVLSSEAEIVARPARWHFPLTEGWKICWTEIKFAYFNNQPEAEAFSAANGFHKRRPGNFIFCEVADDDGLQVDRREG